MQLNTAAPDFERQKTDGCFIFQFLAFRSLVRRPPGFYSEVELKEDDQFGVGKKENVKAGSEEVQSGVISLAGRCYKLPI